jgi:hypothetical protein
VYGGIAFDLAFQRTEKRQMHHSSDDSFSVTNAGSPPLSITIPSARVIGWTLTLCIGFLHLINATRILVHWKFGHGSMKGLFPLFDVDREANIPALYSVLTLFIAAGLAAVVAARERRDGRRFWKHWLGIALAFCWIAIDEGSHIHELTIPLGLKVARHGIFYFAWVIPACAIIGLLTVIYFKMIFSLPSWLRNLAILSAGVFLSGALGMEMIAGPIYEVSGPIFRYQFICAIEEFLEMSGVAIWIYALRRYLAMDRPPLVMALSFGRPDRP